MHFSRKKRSGEATVVRTLIIAGIIAIVGSYGAYRLVNRVDGDDVARIALAQCLTEKGVKMYGAYWCPHCAAQKKAFGKAFRDIDYVECAIPGNQAAQTVACEEAEIRSYPTWIFPNGDRATGEQTMSELAEAAGCAWGEE